MTEKLIIVGSGPAGLTAGIYAARAQLDPLLFEGVESGGIAGGQLMITGLVENYPGFPEGVEGPELMAKMRGQAERMGVRMVLADVTEVRLDQKPFSIVTSEDKTLQAHALIIATGAVARRLPIASEKKLWGKGISACAVCDGGLPVFRNKPLAVIGGGDTAIEEAMHLTRFGSKVYLIHRREEFRASKIMREKAASHPKIEILWNKVVEEFEGEEMLSGLRLKDTKTAEISRVQVTGCFEAIGHVPNTAFLKGQVKTREDGYIVTQPGSTATSLDGVFAAGDVQDPKYRQAVSAAGSGCQAALDAERWLGEKNLL